MCYEYAWGRGHMGERAFERGKLASHRSLMKRMRDWLTSPYSHLVQAGIETGCEMAQAVR